MAPGVAEGPTGLVCEDPPLAELALGSPSDGDVDEASRTRCFWVAVPEGLSSLSFELTGLTSDLNLTVAYGLLVSIQYNTGEVWVSAEDGAADEAVVIQDPQAGPYFIKVGGAGPNQPTPFGLLVRSDPEMATTVTGATFPGTACTPPAEELALGIEAAAEVIARDQPPEARRYFCVEVPDGLSRLTVELTGLSGNLDLFVRRNVPAEWIDRHRGGSERTVVIENPEPGPYYIDVASALPGASSAFTLVVTAP